MLGLLINASNSLTGPKNTFQQSGTESVCQGSLLVFEIQGRWVNSENIPSKDFEFKLPQEDGKEANCKYLHSKQSITCTLKGGDTIQFSDYTMKVGEDEYLLKSKGYYISKNCEGDDQDGGGDKSSSSSMIYSSLLILILLNILLF